MDKLDLCPVCGKEVTKNSSTGKYHCETCNKTFTKAALCDKCGKEVEILAACGSTQFFCDHCNELKSKKTIVFFLKEQP
ncbi:zinc ribbon domain-containing protein [uncultured Ilyobacter sp.]|uniref:zinc ribbon domain-containing protein n=1 Tax=uncultured Ilyobacter sp. TaxID=544433 RepID=UPI0029F48BB1|nr:zinc ribbon domain-containing protein [uncultured Ilyobacter sp.]